ncbi:PLP-dependent aminotransferase family protein [Pseudomonas sp. MH10]|uniref:aminotransferase-like domain-containing protein n=1 Tax=Pseudomonas sp. MH10 TaxID=3048627 RepID=UPI002AC8DD96|nr:PLP-dependent aminotransferase family protein [Pseudomonas sp. MH10]MEB0042864.1 PLP-dependent aminotransferase family protein [Pseudomonas sp. MH10]WPX62467.1 PLP-dependent aminotransferase family protein [Pseudomonas sp. MH10]
MWTPTLTDSGQPKYLALVEAITQAIESGELKVGERLPPQRRLAWNLGLNPSTTMQAYREAARRHLVSGEVGRGTYVLAGSKEATLFRLKQPAERSAVIDLSTNVPVTHENSADEVAALSALINGGHAQRLQNYLSADDLAFGRAQGAAWLNLRGLNLPPEHLMLCNGAQHGLFMALLSLCQPGDPVLVKAFTAPGIKAAGRQLRLPLHGIALDRQGIIADELDRMARATGAKVVVLTPILQNPTSTIMSPQRQLEIAEVARQHDLLIIEDDVYGALTTTPPLTRLLGNRGLLVTSLSKTVAPGLRVGWIAADPTLLELIDPHAQATHWGVSPLCLAIASQWISDGTALRRLAWQTEETTQRWRLAKKILGAALYQQESPSPHAWITSDMPSMALTQACRADLVDVVPAEVFAVKQNDVHAIRISLCAAGDRAQLKIALERVATIIAKQPAQ